MEGVGGDGGDWLTSRAQCGRSLIYRFTGDPFGIGNAKVGMLQFQFVR